VRKCPYCAEQVPDDVVRCPYCDSDLSAHPATVGSAGPAEGSSTGRVVGDGALRFSHSGTTYLLGWGASFFGIWDRNVGGGAVRMFPRTDDGWRAAWLEYTRMETNYVAVTDGES
jgi:hypothetical protein